MSKILLNGLGRIGRKVLLLMLDDPFWMKNELFYFDINSDIDNFVYLLNYDENYNYVKNFHLVDKAILYPEKKIFKKPFFFFKMFLKKNYCTVVCDGKKRSIFQIYRFFKLCWYFNLIQRIK